MKSLPLPRYHPAPLFALHTAAGEMVALRDFNFRQDLLLIFLHGQECPECVRIAGELVEHRNDWEKWGAGWLVLISGGYSPFDLPCRQALDLENKVKERYGAGEKNIVFATIDHLGQSMEGWLLEHPEPVDWHEIAETARWVAVQEPECGTCELLPGWEM